MTDAVTTKTSISTSPLDRVALGTMTFADTADETTARDILRIAVDAGVTWLDTANTYAAGRGEELLGRLLADLPGAIRDQLVVASKVGMPDPEFGAETPLSPENIRGSVERSLRRLGIERLGILYLHQPDRATPLEETFTELGRLRDAGLIDRVGVSNYAAWQIGDAQNLARVLGSPVPDVAQQVYNAIATRLDEEYAEFAAAHGVDTVVYNPLAGGMLTGRYSMGTAAPEGRFRTSASAQVYRDRYWTPEMFAAVEQLTAIAVDADMPLTELALRWLLTRDVVSRILVAGSKAEHVASNLDSLRRGALNSHISERVERVAAGLRGPMPFYNR